MELSFGLLFSVWGCVWTIIQLKKIDQTAQMIKTQKELLGDREAREKRLMDLTSAYMKKAESEMQTFTERLHYIVGAEVSRAIKKQKKGR